MATVFDQLQPFSFGGISFPYESFTVRGGLRDHVFEYPHTAGGAPEKLGRKLYEISVSANFQAALFESSKYNDLWPDRLSRLREFFEQEQTLDLHIPTIGTIKAYAVSWEEIAKNTNRSGVAAQLTFREDLAGAFLVNSVIIVDTSSYSTANDSFGFKAPNTIPAPPSIFTAISEAANAILAYKDQFDLYGSLLESKIVGLVTLLNEADQQVRELNDPANYDVLDAMHELWLANLRLLQDIRERGATLQEFVTPISMPLSAVAARIYGDASKASELLQLNALDDPLDIPASTRIRYYNQAQS